MIRIIRGPEPETLEQEREDGLARARSIVSDPESKLSSRDLHGYNTAAEPLWRAQGNKCCYCETRLERSYNDTEHYRPKMTYWWLTWTWENLLFSCPTCNRRFKRDHFPLRDTSRRLQPEDPPPGREEPMLLDPASGDDPLDSIEFRSYKVARKTRWAPFGKDDRGQTTIALLGLDRDGLIDRYSKHVRLVLQPRLQELKRVIDSGEERAIQQEWRRLLRSCLRTSSPFAALSYDVIAALVSADVREQYRLHLERPPIAERARAASNRQES